MKRTLPGIFLAIAWVLLLVKGNSPLFYLVMVVVAGIGASEYLRMIPAAAPDRWSRVYLGITLCLPIAFTLPSDSGAPAAPLAGMLAAFLLVILYFLRRYTHFDNAYECFAKVVFGVVYVGVLSAYLVLLRLYPYGGSWLVVLSAITAGSDSGAYYFGSAFGRHKLCPNVSPKKTIEGALGGLFCGLGAGCIAAGLLLPVVNWLFLGPAAVALIGVGIIGDLTESVIKRGTGTKDSGKLLAGHGGVLDRIDSLLLTAPVLYYLLLLFGEA